MQHALLRLLYPFRYLSCNVTAYGSVGKVNTLCCCSNLSLNFSSRFVAKRTTFGSLQTFRICRSYYTYLPSAGQVCLLRHNQNSTEDRNAVTLRNGNCCWHSSWTKTFFSPHVSIPLLSAVEGYSAKRYRHRSGKPRKTDEEKAEDSDLDDEEGNSEEEDDDDGDLSHLTFSEDRGLPDNYKETKVHVKSLRLDALVSGGLSITRNKIDDLFLESKLKLNGERVTKKSKQVKVGDYIDLVMSAEEGTQKVKRVRILKVDDSKTSTDKLKVTLRAWKSPFSINA